MDATWSDQHSAEMKSNFYYNYNYEEALPGKYYIGVGGNPTYSAPLNRV